MKCKWTGGKRKKYVYYNSEFCKENIREAYVEEKFKKVIVELLKFDEEYNDIFLPLCRELVIGFVERISIYENKKLDIKFAFCIDIRTNV